MFLNSNIEKEKTNMLGVSNINAVRMNCLDANKAITSSIILMIESQLQKNNFALLLVVISDLSQPNLNKARIIITAIMVTINMQQSVIFKIVGHLLN